jgi:hypothetical protein
VKIYEVITVLLTIAIPIQAFIDNTTIIGGLELVPSSPAYGAFISSTGEIIPHAKVPI